MEMWNQLYIVCVKLYVCVCVCVSLSLSIYVSQHHRGLLSLWQEETNGGSVFNGKQSL